jgi:hypothetical protein
VEEGHNDATTLLNISACSRAVGRRRGCRTLLTPMPHMLDPALVCPDHLVQLSSSCYVLSLHTCYYIYNIIL